MNYGGIPEKSWEGTLAMKSHDLKRWHIGWWLWGRRRVFPILWCHLPQRNVLKKENLNPMVRCRCSVSCSTPLLQLWKRNPIPHPINRDLDILFDNFLFHLQMTDSSPASFNWRELSLLNEACYTGNTHPSPVNLFLIKNIFFLL